MVKGDGEEKRRRMPVAADANDNDGIKPGGLRSPPRARIVAPGRWLRREARIVAVRCSRMRVGLAWRRPGSALIAGVDKTSTFGDSGTENRQTSKPLFFTD